MRTSLFTANLITILLLTLLSGCTGLKAPGEPTATKVALKEKYTKLAEERMGKLPSQIPESIKPYQAWRYQGQQSVLDKNYSEALYCFGEAFKVGPLYRPNLIRTNSPAILVYPSSPGGALLDKANCLARMGHYKPALFYFEKWRENDFMAEKDSYKDGELCCHFELGEYQQVVNKAGSSSVSFMLKGAALVEMDKRDEGMALKRRGWRQYSGGVTALEPFESSGPNDTDPAEDLKERVTPGVIGRVKLIGGTGL